MNRLQRPPTVGIVGCLLYLALLALPYLLIGTESGSGVASYYGMGAINPLVSGLLALVALIILAAGRSGRTEPDLAAGIGIALGVFLVGITGLWAVTVPRSLVLGLSANTLIEHHRWVVVATALAVPVAAGWWARELDLL